MIETPSKHPMALHRAATGLTQKRFGELVGCKRWMINQIEGGNRRPSAQLAARIEQATGIDARILMGIAPAEQVSGEAVGGAL